MHWGPAHPGSAARSHEVPLLHLPRYVEEAWGSFGKSIIQNCACWRRGWHCVGGQHRAGAHLPLLLGEHCREWPLCRDMIFCSEPDGASASIWHWWLCVNPCSVQEHSALPSICHGLFNGTFETGPILITPKFSASGVLVTFDLHDLTVRDFSSGFCHWQALVSEHLKAS